MKNKYTDANIIVVGGIDIHGVVIAHVYIPMQDSELAHTSEEKANVSFRWEVCDQMFMDIHDSTMRNMTEDERFIIQDWLIKRGYADEESFENFVVEK